MRHRLAFAACLSTAIATPAAAAADFTVAVPGGAMTTVRNASAATTVTTAVSDGFAAAIALSASGLPAGVTATFAPATIAAPGAGGATFTLAAGGAAPIGAYTITVTGTGGGLVRSTTVSFTVASTTVTIFSDDFEGAFPGSWSIQHFGANAWWGPSTAKPYAGAKSLYCAASGSAAAPPGGPYPANMNAWVIYGPFSLLGASAAQVNFKFWLQSQTTKDKFQFMWSTSYNTGYWGFTKTGTFGWTTGTLDFDDPLFPTSGLGKPSVYFALIFSSDGSTQDVGAYVDSLSITKTMASTPCTVTCSATVPGAGVAGSPVAVAGTINASSCSGAPSLAWSWGDGAPAGAGPSASHTYAAAGAYPWQMTAAMGGQTCVKNGSTTVAAPACSLSCSATVPAAGNTRAATPFHAEATATNCGAAPAYDWDFGDGAHAATADAAHQYATMGPHSWVLTVTAGSETCTQSAIVAIGQPVHRHLSRSP